MVRRSVLPRLIRSTVLAAVLVAAAVPAFAWGDCDHRAERSGSESAEGASRIVIEARAGDLDVRAASGSRVEARGEACAERRGTLEKIRLVTERDGDVVRVIVEIPDDRGWGDSARMDLEVDVPVDVPLEISDSSGDISVRGVRLARLDDSSGDVDLRDTSGDLRLTDSSGDVSVTEHRGDLELTDSSGDLRLRDVTGSVLVEDDSSGDITADGVSGSVVVRSDSSGDIRVSDVGGDFEVGRDGSGSIDYRDVRGRVDVPAD